MSPTAYPLPAVVTSTVFILFSTETIDKIAPEPFPEEVVVMPTIAIASIGSDPVVVEVFNELGVVFNAVPVPFTNNNPFVVISLFTRSVLFIETSSLKSTVPPPPPVPCAVTVPVPAPAIRAVRPLIAADGILLAGYCA